MNVDRQQQLMRRLIAAAAQQSTAQQSAEQGPHFVDDDAVLDRWAEKAISASEQEAMLAHLDNCSYCREVLSELLQEHLLELPEVEGEDDDDGSSGEELPARTPVESVPLPSPSDSQSVTRRPSSRIQNRSRLRWVLTVAVGLIALTAFILVNSRGTSELAMAQRELLENKPALCLRRLEQLDQKSLRNEEIEELRTLAEQSGYLLSETALESADFASVEKTVTSVARLGGQSARLTNHMLQAAREVPASSTLSREDSLLKYQYDLQGISRGKSLPILDEKTQQIHDQFEAAIATYGKDVTLRLNFGQFLLTFGRAAEAESQFELARSIQPNNEEVHLGIGLAAFEKKDFQKAAKAFERAAELAPNSFAAHLNAAISWERLGQPARAAGHWSSAENLAPDEAVRAAISTRRKAS